MTQAGLKAASSARAITGAQGRTGEGSPLFAELQNLQAFVTEARTARYAGNVKKYEQGLEAKNYINKAPKDIIDALLAGASLFKEKK